MNMLLPDLAAKHFAYDVGGGSLHPHQPLSKFSVVRGTEKPKREIDAWGGEILLSLFNGATF